MSEFTESTLEEPGIDAIADFRSAQASSDVGGIGSLQESDCSNISRKLQVTKLISSFFQKKNSANNSTTCNSPKCNILSSGQSDGHCVVMMSTQEE